MANRPSERPVETRGVPRKLTAHLTAKLVAELRKGHVIKAACAAAGIHWSTFFDWCERGKQARAEEIAGRPVARSEQPCLVFLEKVELAGAFAQWRTFENFLTEAGAPRGKGNWLPWLKLLERRWPDDFAERRALISDGDQDAKPESLDLSGLTREEKLDLLRLVRKAREATDGSTSGEDHKSGRRLRAV